MTKQIPPLVCDPPCSMGVCVSNGTSNLGRCKCDPFFTGDTCDVYSCHTYCHNNGICYVELGPSPENETIHKVLLIVLIFCYFIINLNCFYCFIN